MQLSLTTAASAALLTLSSITLAAGTDPSDRPAAPEKSPDAVGPRLDESYVAEVNRRALGVGLGLDQGYWGTGFGHGLRIDVPFHRHFGARARGLIAYGPSDGDAFDPALFGAVELFGRGPVMFGLARMYGGGGIHVGGRPNPQDDGEDTFGIGGGGHLGIEMFLNPGYSFSVEVGGQAPVHSLGYDAGASVMGGMTFYVGG